MKHCSKCGQELPEETIQEIKVKTLEWGECSDEEMTWQEAKAWCKAQGEGWRMPTRGELIQAYDEKVGGFTGNYFWSSTEYYNGTANAWYVNLSYGFTFNNPKATSYGIRCVRP